MSKLILLVFVTVISYTSFGQNNQQEKYIDSLTNDIISNKKIVKKNFSVVESNNFKSHITDSIKVYFDIVNKEIRQILIENEDAINVFVFKNKKLVQIQKSNEDSLTFTYYFSKGLPFSCVVYHRNDATFEKIAINRNEASDLKIKALKFYNKCIRYFK